MFIRVIMLPHQGMDLSGDVCVGVDVIRATTTLVSLFEAGAQRVYLSRARTDSTVARGLAGADALLCAEQDNGALPPGFDCAPSPIALARHDLVGRTVVLATANGTPAAMLAVQGGAREVLFAALRNVTTAAATAARTAMQVRSAITILCAGRLRNSRITLDDVYCAGLLVQRLAALVPSEALELDDSAIIATRLAETFPDPQAALLDSGTGRRFCELGFRDDVLYCAETDRSDIVPRLVEPGACARARWPVSALAE